MRVYAAQFKSGLCKYQLQRVQRLVRAHAELGIHTRGLYIGVRVRVHTRIYAQEHHLALAYLLTHLGEAFDFLSAVQHDAPHAHVERGLKLHVGLVAAMHYYVFSREARLLGDVQLTQQWMPDTNNQPMAGLYITGDMSGSFFANNYPCLMAGVAMGRTLTFAMKAIKQMAGLE